MKRLGIILLTLVFVTQAFYNAGALAYWLVNRSFIENNFCINKDKPELDCRGKCYLEKKVVVSNDDLNPKNIAKVPTLKKGIELALCDELPFFPIFGQTQDRLCTVVIAYDLWLIQHKPDGVFHPPSC